MVFVCTGNAARSVMAGAILAARTADIRVTTAGTHVVEGMPMSWRTRDAMLAVGVDPPRHRSRQLRDEDVAQADLVVALAVEHVEYIRRTHPEAVGMTGTLRRLVRDLVAGPEPLRTRVAALRLGQLELEPWEDVADPAGGDLPEYTACARDVLDLVVELAPRLH